MALLQSSAYVAGTSSFANARTKRLLKNRFLVILLLVVQDFCSITPLLEIAIRTTHYDRVLVLDPCLQSRNSAARKRDCPGRGGRANRVVDLFTLKLTQEESMRRNIVTKAEQHLRRLGLEYLGYYHEDRTHIGLEKTTPARRPIEACPNQARNVLALPRIGGLHHRYTCVSDDLFERT